MISGSLPALVWDKGDAPVLLARKKEVPVCVFGNPNLCVKQNRGQITRYRHHEESENRVFVLERYAKVSKKKKEKKRDNLVTKFTPLTWNSLNSMLYGD